MTQIKRLVFFGCSITNGTGLPEHKQRDLVWTKVLSDNLNLDSLNLAQTGCSNHDIYKHAKNFTQNRLREYPHYDGDFLVIALTGLVRNSLYYLESHTDKLALSIDSINRLYHHLTDNNIPFVFCEAFVKYERFVDFDKEIINKFLLWEQAGSTLYDMINDTQDIDNLTGNVILNYDHFHDTSNSELFLPCSHPSSLGHEKIADKLTPIISEHLAAFSDK